MKGLKVTPSNGMTRLELECPHQHGLIYVTDGAVNNWVCSRLLRPAHSLAGFMRELAELKDPKVRDVMQRWGLYFRTMPIKEAEEVEASDDG